MGVFTYALMAYALTAIISFGVISLIVLVNYLMNRKSVKNIQKNNHIGSGVN